MSGHRGSYYGHRPYPHARPFDDFLIENPTTNPGSMISLSGNFNHPVQSRLAYAYMSNVFGIRFPYTTLLAATTTPHRTGHSK